MANKNDQPQASNLPASHAKFGKPIISLADSDTVYTGRDGSKSIKIASVLLPILSCAVKITATVYARLDSKLESVSATASLSRDVKVDDTDARNEILAHIETAFGAWPNYSNAMQDGVGKLTGVKQPNAAGTFERPRLVMPVKPLAVAPVVPAVAGTA